MKVKEQFKYDEAMGPRLVECQIREYHGLEYNEDKYVADYLLLLTLEYGASRDNERFCLEFIGHFSV